MTPEETAKLDRALTLAEENNKILRGLRRSDRASTVIHITYWVIIIALSFGAFYFIQPYINFMTGIIGSDNSTTSGQSNTGSSNLLNVLKQAQSSGSSLQDLLK